MALSQDAAIAVINEMVQDGCTRAEICSELVEQGAARASAYRWTREHFRVEEKFRSAGLQALEAAMHVLHCALADDDGEAIITAAKAVASIEKSVKSR